MMCSVQLWEFSPSLPSLDRVSLCSWPGPGRLGLPVPGGRVRSGAGAFHCDYSLGSWSATFNAELSVGKSEQEAETGSAWKSLGDVQKTHGTPPQDEMELGQVPSGYLYKSSLMLLPQKHTPLELI